VNDTPNAFVSETGHATNITTPGGLFCITGQADCVFYDTAHRLGFEPLKIVSVGVANGSTPASGRR
jgi:hypothetical protein